MNLLQQLAQHIEQAGAAMGSRGVHNMITSTEPGIVPPPQVSNSKTGQAQTPYKYYSQAQAKAQSLPAPLLQQLAKSQGRGLQVQPLGPQDPGQPDLGVSFHQIQGRDNPGYIPLQNSGAYGPGYSQNLQPAMPVSWQNTGNRRTLHYNPQVNDNGYYYDN